MLLPSLPPTFFFFLAVDLKAPRKQRVTVFKKQGALRYCNDTGVTQLLSDH